MVHHRYYDGNSWNNSSLHLIRAFLRKYLYQMKRKKGKYAVSYEYYSINTRHAIEENTIS